MIYDGLIEGSYVNLRSVKVDDAEFALSLRQNPNLTQFMPKLDITVEQQRAWIEKQRNLEGDFFFIVEDKSGKKIGVISIYNIDNNTCESGRIVMIGKPIQTIEAQLLIFDFAFRDLKIKSVYHFNELDNDKSSRLAETFGSVMVKVMKDDGREVLKGTISKESYLEKRAKLTQLLYKH